MWNGSGGKVFLAIFTWLCCKLFITNGCDILFGFKQPSFLMFKCRHFDKSIIHLCVRWYLAHNLSLHNQKEMMAERSVDPDHSIVGPSALAQNY